MATVFERNHNAGGVLSDYWTVSDASGSMSLAAAAGLNGTAFGVKCDHDAPQVGSSDLTTTYTALSGNDMRFRLWVNLDNLSHSGSGTTGFLQVDVRTNVLFRVEIETDGAVANGYEVNFQYKNDGDLFFSDAIADIDLPSGEICIEFAATRETSDGAADGTMEGFVNGVSKGSVSNIENFNNWASISTARVRFNQIPAGQSPSGFIYVDEIILDDDSSSALCPAPIFTAAPMKKPCDIDADGDFIYIATLDSLGQPALIKFSTALNADGTVVFQPGAGSNIGVQCGRKDADIIWIAGAFDGTNTVEKSEDAGTSFDVKDPATFGAVSAFIVGPDSDDRVLIVDDGVDIQETTNDGGEWIAKNTGLTPVTKSLARLDINVEEVAFGNESGANDNVDYSVNTGADLEDLNLPVAADVSSIIVN